jgi:hypothetical protein
MKKKDLIAAIEKDGLYYNVRIDKQSQVTGVPVDEPNHYHKMTNTGGRRFIGWMDEIIDVFIASGKISENNM